MVEMAKVAAGFGAVVCAAVLAGAPARAADPPSSCGHFRVGGVALGETRTAVRAQLGRERTTTRILRDGREEATAAEYGEGASTVHVEYDHRLDRRPEPHVVLVRTTIPPTEEALTALVDRWGAPSVWTDAAGVGPEFVGPVVWVDERCGSVASVYHDAGAWWADSEGLSLQVETLDLARRGESPASALLKNPSRESSPPTP